MTQEKKIYQPITSGNICRAYELLLDSGLVSFPIRESSKAKIEAIVANINNTYFGREIYRTIEEKAIAYLYFLIKDHPFTDGNKRTACLVFEIVCDINDLDPNFDKFKLDQLAVFIETIRDDNHQEIISAISNIIFKLNDEWGKK